MSMLARRKPEAEASPRVLRSLQATCNARGLAALAERIADLDDEQLDTALADGAHLVVTDSNRRRIQTWFNSLP